MGQEKFTFLLVLLNYCTKKKNKLKKKHLVEQNHDFIYFRIKNVGIILSIYWKLVNEHSTKIIEFLEY